MADLDLDALQKLADEATPGPWIGEGGCIESSSAKRWIADSGDWGGQISDADAVFIAAAREAVPALIARVRELEAHLEAIYKEVNDWRDLFANGDVTAQHRAAIARLRKENDRLRALADDPRAVEAAALKVEELGMFYSGDDGRTLIEDCAQVIRAAVEAVLKEDK